jgi:hypothetical protein
VHGNPFPSYFSKAPTGAPGLPADNTRQNEKTLIPLKSKGGLLQDRLLEPAIFESLH